MREGSMEMEKVKEAKVKRVRKEKLSIDIIVCVCVYVSNLTDRAGILSSSGGRSYFPRGETLRSPPRASSLPRANV